MVTKDFEELFACLNAHGVRAIIVGGYAFAFHAKPRYTKDIDLFVDATAENAGRIIHGARRLRLWRCWSRRQRLPETGSHHSTRRASEPRRFRDGDRRRDVRGGVEWTSDGAVRAAAGELPGTS
jgi:hypothetical protein